MDCLKVRWAVRLPGEVALVGAFAAVLVTIGPAAAQVDPVARGQVGVAGRAKGFLRGVPPMTRQVIEVSASSWRTSYARLRTWRLTPEGEWVSEISAPARLGANGLVRERLRKQNTSTTPAGTFSLGQAFGIGTAPRGMRVPYRSVTDADYWVYDPADPPTYNSWIKGRSTKDEWRLHEAEHLIEYGTQYRYAVVIDYNHAVGPGKPDTAAGGGIFLHVNGDGPTSGCVSIPRSKMARVLRWLDPQTDPRIVIRVVR